MKTALTLLIFSVASLVSLGMITLYSASMNPDVKNLVFKQGVAFFIGLTGCGIVAAYDYRKLPLYAPALYFGVVLMLALVLIPGVGTYTNGARRWFVIGGWSFQPSEAAKIGIILVMAHYGSNYKKYMTRFWAGTVFPMAIFGVVALLIFREPDYGTALLVATVCSIVLLLAGVRWIHLFPPIVAGFSLIVYAISTNQNRMNRILAWLFPDKFQDGIGYQAHEAKVALGMGGWQGVGLGNGVQKLGRVPENETDFIFSILGEELGLIATLSVILLFMLLVFCGIYIAVKSNNDFGFLLASGITFMIGLQAFINIGVVTSVLPNKGIALPFISYGGSNLTMMLVAIGILISVGLHLDNSENDPMHSFDSMGSCPNRIL